MAEQETVKVRYAGRYAEVLLPLPDGTTILAKKGEAIEVPAGDFAAGLLVQEANWQPSGKAAQETAKAVQAAEPADAETKGG